MLPPLTVEQIARQAGQYEFDPQVPLRYWLRSAGLLVKEVGNRHHQLSPPPPPPPLTVFTTGSNIRTRRQRPAGLPPPFQTCPARPHQPHCPPRRPRPKE